MHNVWGCNNTEGKINTILIWAICPDISGYAYCVIRISNIRICDPDMAAQKYIRISGASDWIWLKTAIISIPFYKYELWAFRAMIIDIIQLRNTKNVHSIQYWRSNLLKGFHMCSWMYWSINSFYLLSGKRVKTEKVSLVGLQRQCVVFVCCLDIKEPCVKVKRIEWRSVILVKPLIVTVYSCTCWKQDQ